ncbi:MAG: gluconokinase [Nocardioides sp.]
MAGLLAGGAARHLVFMGVSGTGKSAIGSPVAAALGCDFAEGDDFHPQSNVDKMSSGTPLTDDDRWPWLESLAVWTRERAEAGTSTALTCSALRRSYRDVLRTGAEDTVFVHLTGDEDVIRRRMESRHHFMPPTLLRSQLDTLEPPDADELSVRVDIDAPLEEIVARLVRDLS